MEEKRFTELASLYLAGEASPGEKQELDELLAAHPEWASRLTALRQIWLAKPASSVNKDDAYSRHLKRLEARLAPDELHTTPKPPLRKPRHFALPNLRVPVKTAAAIAAAVGGLTILLSILIVKSQRKPASPSEDISISTKAGARKQATLPDGTSVVLNADSKLTYKNNPTSDAREVQLSGEAYFDVAKDPHRPFVIHTATVDINVLGTAFNVRSYDNERTTETELIQGAVEIMLRNKPDKRIILKPNEKLTIHNEQMTLTASTSTELADAPLMTVGKVHFHKKDSTINEVAWTRGLLVFDNARLDDVALQLQHWYGVNVKIGSEKLTGLRLNATFGKENLHQAMEALSIAGAFTYTIQGKEVIIEPLDPKTSQ